jgi:hypothetical protein
MNENDEYILACIRSSVWSGFYGADQIDQQIDDLLEEDSDEQALRAAAQTELRAKKAAEASWPAVTDCDRLDAAFAELERSGLIALQNAGYTMSDGHSDVGDVLARRERDQVKGFCFYHGQDLERAVEGGGLMLAYGDLDAEPGAKTAVGHLVAAALRRAGFEVEWNGDPEKRIFLPRVDWKRRLRT